MDKILLALQSKYPELKSGDYELVLNPNTNQYTVTKWPENLFAPTSQEISVLINQIQDDYKWSVIREKRNFILEKTDWTQIQDAVADKQAWAEYRQKLRDITKNVAKPENVVWPKSPDNKYNI